MNDNEISPSTQSTGPSQPMPQPVPQPAASTPAPAPAQPIPSQPPQSNQFTPQPLAQPVFNGPTAGATASPSNGKKRNIIIGSIIGVIILAVLATVLFIVLGSNGEKTVSCTTQQSTYGISATMNTTIKVKNGEMPSGKADIVIDLKSLNSSYRDREKEIADQIIESYKNECESHCSFNSSYTEGDNIALTMEYDKDGVKDNIMYAYGIENMSAQEIADKVQQTMEKQADTVCKQ